MQNKVVPFAATPDPTYGQPPNGKAPAAASRTEEGIAASDEAELRLVIEEDEATGAYVYKTVNRRTGEVVQQLPREEVLKLARHVDYHAGGVIRTKA
jgi:flagellar protein FlaG